MKTVEDQIQEQYDCIERLGSGAFGHLILVRSKNDEQLYACKIEKNHGKKAILVQKQFRILADLMDTKRFPKVYTYRVLEQNSYMIMEKLDQNLDSIFKANGRKFELKTIALIANQMFQSIEILHNNSILHRDLKPENIMTCYESHTIKLIDFGLAEKKFAKQSVAMIGNVRFCSRMAHFGHSGKKEDLESMLYVLYYFLVNQLPWQDANESDIRKEIQRNVKDPNPQPTLILTKKNNFLQEIQSKKPQIHNKIHEAFYDQLYGLASYIMNLTPESEIDYSHIIHWTERLMLIVGVRKGDCFQWCKRGCLKGIPYKKYWDVMNV